MTFCTNCRSQDTHRLEDTEGRASYQLVDDLRHWGPYHTGNYPLIVYTSYICNECGNFFARGVAVKDLEQDAPKEM